MLWDVGGSSWLCVEGTPWKKFGCLPCRGLGCLPVESRFQAAFVVSEVQVPGHLMVRFCQAS